MKAGITFALMSLVIAGLNDVVFKRYSLKDRSRGMYIFGIGVIWTLLQAGHTVMSDTPLQWSPATIGFGLAAGILLTLSNILLLESFTHIAVSFGSTIYRLNTIGVVLLSTSILGENLPLFKIVGILLGLAAVSLLYHRDTGHTHDRTFILFAGLAVIASLLRACYGVVSKAGLTQHADGGAMLLLIALCWIIGGACYAKLQEKRIRFTGKKMVYSLISGVLVFLIVNFLMLALKHEEASIVIPIANMSFIVALLVSTVLKMEKLTARKLFALGCAAVAIVLLAKA
jgi:drug/metabolite transporter (DMT)-like permease